MEPRNSCSTRRTSRALYFLSAILLVSPVAVLAEEASQETAEAAKPRIEAPEWMLVVSPTVGLLKNTTTFPVPVGRDENDELEFAEYEMTDTGWGGGVTLMGFYKWVAFTEVLFGFPDVNHAKLLGSITYLSVTIPTPVFVEPYLGTGLAMIRTDAYFVDFRDTRIDSMNNGTLWLEGHAHMETISVANRVISPFPKIGAKFKIPIQHWYVTPFYSFLYEYVKTRARSDGGAVDLYECTDSSCDELVSDAPWDTVEVRSFDKTTVKYYQSHLVGLDFLIDFHYFLQLRGKVYYNTNHNLWTARLIGTMLFNENIGISAYFEYTQKITVTNTYFLVGPAFLFSPEKFRESIREMKTRRKAGKRS